MAYQKPDLLRLRHYGGGFNPPPWLVRNSYFPYGKGCYGGLAFPGRFWRTGAALMPPWHIPAAEKTGIGAPSDEQNRFFSEANHEGD